MLPPMFAEKPRRSTERVQRCKLVDRDPRISQSIEKVAVKVFGADLLGKHWVTPTLWSGAPSPTAGPIAVFRRKVGTEAPFVAAWHHGRDVLGEANRRMGLSRRAVPRADQTLVGKGPALPIVAIPPHRSATTRSRAHCLRRNAFASSGVASRVCVSGVCNSGLALRLGTIGVALLDCEGCFALGFASGRSGVSARVWPAALPCVTASSRSTRFDNIWRSSFSGVACNSATWRSSSSIRLFAAARRTSSSTWPMSASMDFCAGDFVFAVGAGSQPARTIRHTNGSESREKCCIPHFYGEH
ncbi:conserved hypothetical protein [Sphingomonas aurantiaca]|uniref:Uncharacterized protein n=1 Tax=Sphingomonas aurantiaca TaxID=185949 RepID=A0A5E7ZJR8_9SPHN|nr:conserved hypothetical protein [Sphingomonas aurantiaca]